MWFEGQERPLIDVVPVIGQIARCRGVTAYVVVDMIARSVAAGR